MSNFNLADSILKILKEDAERNYKHYEEMLNEKYDGSIIDDKKQGLARELARMNLTLNSYTQWYWKTDLLNLLNFFPSILCPRINNKIFHYSLALA